MGENHLLIVSATGAITSMTDVLAMTTSLKGHVHGGVLSGDKITQPPM